MPSRALFAPFRQRLPPLEACSFHRAWPELRALESAIPQLPLGHHAFAFLEQVWQDAVVTHGNRLRRVGHYKADSHPIALDAAGFDQSAQSEGAAVGASLEAIWDGE